MNLFKRCCSVITIALALCLSMAAQDASQLTTQLINGGPGGPITYNPATHVLTITNTADVSTPMTLCSQYNMYGQCQGTPATYYHTATGSVTVHNYTKNTSATGYDQKVGGAMNATTSIFADPGDDVRLSESQTIYCPAVLSYVVNTSIIDYHVEIALTKAVSTGGAPTNCRTIAGATFCTFNSQPWCTPSTTPPDKNVTGVQWQFSQGPRPFWLVTAVCISPTGHQPWGCSPGLALDGGVDTSLFLCTHNP